MLCLAQIFYCLCTFWTSCLNRLYRNKCSRILAFLLPQFDNAIYVNGVFAPKSHCGKATGKMNLFPLSQYCLAILFLCVFRTSAETCDCSFSQGDYNGHLLVLIGSAAENSPIGTEIIDRGRQVKVIPPTANVILVASPRPDCPTAVRDEDTYFHVAQEEKSGALTINIAKQLSQLVRPHDISACSYQATMQLMCGKRCDTGIQFMVTIYDVNDHAPEFEQPAYTLDIPESTPPGMTPFHLSATDADRIGSPNSEMSIELLQGSSADHTFRLVNSASCNKTFMCEAQLELLHAIDFEKGPRIYHLQAVATDKGTPPLSTTVPLTIKVLDVDDEDPTFEAYTTNQHYRVRLEEESDPATVNFGPKDIRPSLIRAHDQDVQVNERLIYSVEPNPYFDIDPVDGTLHMKMSIDRESQTSPTTIVGPFMLYATEMFEPVHTGAAMVQIDLTDINDNAPLFVAPRFYNTSIRENNAINAYSGITVEASDADGPPYNVIAYEIVEGNEAGLFHADGANGRFYVSAPLDFEQRREHHLRLRATNREPYDPKFAARLENLADSICHIVVTVEDVNDCAPEFPPGEVSFEIPEDMRVGAAVGMVVAHDNDTVGIDTYDLKDTALGITNIIVDTGRNNNNNRRQKRQILAETPLSTTTEGPPRTMTTGPGTSDSGGTAYFSIHPLRGQLYVSSSLENTFLGFEAKKFYLDVIADDGVNAKAVKHITVTVYDVNNNAPIFTRSDYGKINVSELAQPGSIVYARIHATDLDSGKYGHVTYSLEPSQQLSRVGITNAADLPFAIDPETGAILLKFAVNYVQNVVKSYPLVVTARDGGEPNNTKSAQAMIELIITNEHINPPIVLNISRFQVEETASRSVRIGRINATNIDGGTLEYGWVPTQATTNSPIALDPLSGELFVVDTAGIDFEKVQQLQLPAFVRDGNDARAHTVSTMVIVDIINMNDNPPIFTQATFTQNWMEDTPLTLRIEAHDADLPPWNLITYSLDLDGENVDDMMQKTSSEHSNRKFPFTLNSTSGELGLKFPLPEDAIVFSRQPTFHFAVLATDNGGLKDRAYVMIHLVDSNNHTPVFEQQNGYHAAVSEVATVGTMILRVKAICNDFNPDLQYEVSLMPTNSSSDFKQHEPYFMIVPGTDAVIVTHELDRELEASYQLLLRVHNERAATTNKNSAVNYGNTTLFIKILDANDNPPVFEHGMYEFDIEEERRYVNFGKVNATDKDEGKNAEFDFKIVGNVVPVIVTANNNTNSLKRSRRAVTMTSNGRFCGENDPNCDQSAWFNFDNDQIALNAALPTTSSTSTTTTTPRPTTDVPTSYFDELPARDPQPTPLVQPPFDVNALSGFFSTRGRIDRDTLPQDFFKFQVIATDHGDKPLTGTTTVLVRVIDINDNAPEIADAYKTVQVEEGRVATFTVVATDRDIGENAIIRYALKNSSYSVASRNDTQNFTINEFTGVVKSVGPLWIFGTKQEFHIDVETYNIVPLVGPAAQQTSNAIQQVTIQIHDINNNPPIFDNQTYGYEVVLTENDAQLNKNVLVLHANDADLLPENRMLKYSLVPSPSQVHTKQLQVFRIDPDSGAIFIVANVTPLLTDILTSFPLTASVTDGPHTSYANVTINILDSNNHAPECKVSRAHLRIGETTTPEALLREQPGIVCTDADFGDNALLHYVLEFDVAGSRYNKSVVSTGNTSAPPQAFRLASESKPLIELARAVDYHEGDRLFKFGLRVLDSGEPVSQTLVPLEIEILNENNHPPEFPIPANSSYNFEIAENAPLGFVLGNVTAYDRDGDALTYKLLLAPQNSSAGSPNFYAPKLSNNPFSVSSQQFLLQPGLVVVSQKLDAVRPPKDYDLIISAFDGLHTTEAKVYVHVLDVNKFAPEFAQLVYSGEVPEFDGPEDDLNQPMFIPVVNNNARHLFKRDLAEQKNSQTSSDNQTAVAEQQAKEQLERIGQPIFNISATDKDFGSFGQVRYELASGNYDIQPVDGSSSTSSRLSSFPLQPTLPAALPFTIDGLTGALMVRSDGLAQLQYESPVIQDGALSSSNYAKRANALRAHNNEFLFYVKAIDGGGLSTRAGVRIRIVDRNNKWPKFERTQYNIQIFEDGPPSCIDTDIVAHDEDTVGQLTYFVTNASLAQKFRYDHATHRLCTRVKLDREEIALYDVDLSVFDEIHTTHTNVHVKVLDVNDHAPVFLPHPDLVSDNERDSSTLHIHVPEDIALNTNILNMAAHDDDEGTNAEIDYFLHGAGEADTFDIDAFGNIKVIHSLVGKNGRHALKIIARDRGNPPLNTSADVLVYVNSTNEHAPEFERLLYTAVLRENAPPGQTVARLNAPDPDEGESGNVHFRITHARPDNDSFVVIKQSRSSAVLRALRPLDYEKPEERFYELIVEARDNAYAQRTSTAIVQVLLQDENDNAPTLALMPEQVRYLGRSLHVDSVLYRFYAFDPDSGANGHTTINLLACSHPQLVTLRTGSNDNTTHYRHQHTELILTAEPRAVVIEVEVSATDHGIPARQSLARTLGIKIVEDVDSTPLFKSSPVIPVLSNGDDEDQLLWVEEESPSGTRLNAHVQAVSGDGAPIIYQLMLPDDAASEEARFFSMEPQSGAVFLLSHLHKPTRPVYHLPVMAVNSYTPSFSSEGVIVVHVRRFHDECPYFPLSVYTTDVAENVNKNALVMTLTAVEPDKSTTSNVTFAIEHNTPSQSNGLFALRSTFGNNGTNSLSDLNTNDEPGYRAAAQRLLQTQVIVQHALDADYTTTNNNVSMNLAIATANHHASLLHRERRSVPSDDQSLSQLTGVSYNSDDVVHTITVSLRDTLDRRAQKSSGLQCVDTALILIRVLNVNDGIPQFNCDRYEGTVLENSLPQTNVCIRGIHCSGLPNRATLAAMKHSRFRRSVANEKRSDGSNVRPWLYPTALSKASTDSTKTGNDLQGRSSPNNNNMCPNLLLASCERIAAQDPDAGDTETLHYGISAGDDPVGYFYLDSRTGQLFVNRVGLDRETTPAYHLTITATDRAGNVGNATLIVVVEDEDDNAPIFTFNSDNVTVQENKALVNPQRLYKLNATDADIGENARIIYLIVNAGSSAAAGEGDASARFRVDEQGWVWATGPLDRDALMEASHRAADAGNGRALYPLTILATNPKRSQIVAQSLPSQIFRLNILINDTNDTPPMFPKSEYFVEVPSNSPVPLKVLQLEAKDPDYFQPSLRYRILNTASPFQIVQNDQQSGVMLMLTERFTHYDDMMNEMPLTIEVDDGLHRAQTRVRVHIVRTRRAPHFLDAEYHMSVPEMVPNNTRVGKVSGIDPDQQQNRDTSASTLTYSLRSFSDADTTNNEDAKVSSSLSKHFRIDPQTGEIYTKAGLLRETATHYLLLAEVRSGRRRSGSQKSVLDDDDDFGTATARVFVTILDVNKPPVFHPAVYEFTVDEGYYGAPSALNLGLLVGKVNVDDKNEGENGRITRLMVTPMSEEDGLVYFDKMATKSMSSTTTMTPPRTFSNGKTTDYAPSWATELKPHYQSSFSAPPTTTTTQRTISSTPTTSTTLKTFAVSDKAFHPKSKYSSFASYGEVKPKPSTTSTTSTTTTSTTTTTTSTTAKPTTTSTTSTTKSPPIVLLSSAPAKVVLAPAKSKTHSEPQLKGSESEMVDTEDFVDDEQTTLKPLSSPTSTHASVKSSSAPVTTTSAKVPQNTPKRFSDKQTPTTTPPTSTTAARSSTPSTIVSSTTPSSSTHLSSTERDQRTNITNKLLNALAAVQPVKLTTVSSTTVHPSVHETTDHSRKSTTTASFSSTHTPHISSTAATTTNSPQHIVTTTSRITTTAKPFRAASTTAPVSKSSTTASSHRFWSAVTKRTTPAPYQTSTIHVPRWIPTRRGVHHPSAPRRDWTSAPLVVSTTAHPTAARRPLPATQRPPVRHVVSHFEVKHASADTPTTATPLRSVFSPSQRLRIQEHQKHKTGEIDLDFNPVVSTTTASSSHLDLVVGIEPSNANQKAQPIRLAEDDDIISSSIARPAVTSTNSNHISGRTSVRLSSKSDDDQADAYKFVDAERDSHPSLHHRGVQFSPSHTHRVAFAPRTNDEPTIGKDEESAGGFSYTSVVRRRRDTGESSAASSPSFQLSANPQTSELRLFGNADYEASGNYWTNQAHHTYYFNVTAIDGGRPSLGSTAFVKIVLRDVNDNQPQFIGLPESVKPIVVSEHAQAGQEVMHFVAYDRDSGANGRVLLDISSSMPVVTETGSNVTMVENPWAPLIRKYFYLHTVSVENKPSDVAPTPEMLPAIRSASSYARGTLRLSRRLLTFLVAAQEFARKHSIQLPASPMTNHLILPLYLVARDMGEPVALSNYAEMRLNIQQAADRPEFERLVTYVSVDDAASVNSVVYTANLKQPVTILNPHGQKLPRFSIVNGDGDDSKSRIFNIHETTGIVSLAKSLKTVLKTRHVLTLQVTTNSQNGSAHSYESSLCSVTNSTSSVNRTTCDPDDAMDDFDAPMSDTSVLIITINKVRQFPQTRFEFKIPENERSLMTEPIYDFDTSVELDGQSPVTYKLHGPTKNLFLLESASGRLFLRQPLDYEQQNTHTLLIEVLTPDWQQTLSSSIVNDMNDDNNKNGSWVRDDDELHFNEAKIIFHVLDKNDIAPFFPDNQRRIFGVMRRSPMSTWFGNVQARDVNTPEFGSLRYRIEPPPGSDTLSGRGNFLTNESAAANAPPLDERQIAASLVYVNAITGDLFTAVPLYLAGPTIDNGDKHRQHIVVPIQAVNDGGHGLVSKTLRVKMYLLDAAQVVRVVCRLPAETAGEMSSNLTAKFNKLLPASLASASRTKREVKTSPYTIYALSVTPHLQADGAATVVRAKSDMRLFGVRNSPSSGSDDDTLVESTTLLHDLSALLPKMAPPLGSSEVSLFDTVLPVDDSWQQPSSLTTAILGSEMTNNQASSSSMRPAEIALLTIAVLLIVISAAGFVAGCYVISRRSRRNSATSCRPSNGTETNGGAVAVQQNNSSDKNINNSKWDSPFKRQLFGGRVSDPLGAKKPLQDVKSVVSYDDEPSSGESSSKQQTSPSTTTASIGRNTKNAEALSTTGAAAARSGVVLDPSTTTTGTTASTSSPSSSMVGSALSMLNKASATASSENVNTLKINGSRVKLAPSLPSRAAQQPRSKQSFLDRIFGAVAKNGDLGSGSVGRRSSSSTSSLDQNNNSSASRTRNDIANANSNIRPRVPLVTNISSSGGGATSTESPLTSENTKSITPPLLEDSNKTSAFVLPQYDARGRRETINPMFLVENGSTSSRGGLSHYQEQNDSPSTTTFQPQQQKKPEQRPLPIIPQLSTSSLMSTLSRDSSKKAANMKNNHATTGAPGVQAALRYNATRMPDYLYDADHLPAHQYRGQPSSRRAAYADNDQIHDDNFLLAPPGSSSSNITHAQRGEVSDKVMDDYYDDLSVNPNGGKISRRMEVSDDPAYHSPIRSRTQQLLEHHHYHSASDQNNNSSRRPVDEEQQQHIDDSTDQATLASGARFGIFRPLTPMLELSVEGSQDSLDAVLDSAAAHMNSSGDERPDAQKESNYYFPALITKPQQSSSSNRGASRRAPQ